MALKEQVIAAADTILAGVPAGLTGEALAREIARQVGRQIPPAQIAKELRALPQRFVEGSDGRWRVREREGILVADDAGSPGDAEALLPPPAPARILKPGCYLVFDLEATGQDPQAPETEIIQIAAQRWVDGTFQDA